MDTKLIGLQFTAGIRTALMDGTLVSPSPFHMATEMLYYAEKGARLTLTTDGYVFAPALFSPVRDEKYIYTYDYQKESNWTRYDRNLTPQSYGKEDFVFEEERYFRVCVKREDGAAVTPLDAETAERELLFYQPVDTVEKAYAGEKPETEAVRKPKAKTARKPEAEALGSPGAKAVRKPEAYFMEELQDTVEKALAHVSGSGMERDSAKKFTFGLLADTHYTINGTWEDTAANLREAGRQIGFDAVIHLGDLTDGLVSRRVTQEYAGRVLRGMEACGVPVYIAVGNHDWNYFQENPEAFDEKQMLDIYGGAASGRERLYYFVDFGETLRCLFLSAFDPGRPVRYGFDDGQLKWVEETLRSTPKERRVIVFSHDAPLAKLDYWSYLIWNGRELLDILEEYNARENSHILAFIHGHAHGDFIYDKCSFPIVAIGSGKCEYFTDKKPKGFRVPRREPGTVSQDLWDVMIVDTEAEKIEMVRFGAGEDRTLDCRKKTDGRRLADELFIGYPTEQRRLKVWAHRGVSGHAPENTLPAFELAVRMQADGVELDVQMSADGELVVIHDERIDRVSDGTGYVKDYTLTELKQRNFNHSFPAYGSVPIPTLREALQLLRSSGLTVNLELKNGVFFYEELEERTLKLVQEMGMEDRVLYSSFNHISMLTVKKLMPHARTAFLYSDGLLEPAAYAQRHGMYALHPWVKNLQYPGFAEECGRRGIRIHTWTVNEPEDIEIALRAGVDAVITNYPERITK